MQQIRQAIRSMISVSDAELDGFLALCSTRTYRKKEILCHQGAVSKEIYFINRGITRNITTDKKGTEHTTHFALEGQFIADYASFLQQSPALDSIQALEDTEVVIMPRAAIDWGYKHMQQGDRMGRLIAEYYFIYLDDRIKNIYATDPVVRYRTITERFPNIHNRVPQHMIASYLGITSVHLSRLKKTERSKT